MPDAYPPGWASGPVALIAAPVMKSKAEYDVCVIGSGASGGIAARVLSKAGLKVALLEAGPELHVDVQYKQYKWIYDLADRGLNIGGTGDKVIADGAFSLDGEPYSSSGPATFRWFRSRLVGGRTNHWGRGVSRFSESDFRSWPLTSDELSPFYRKVEEYIGVTGLTDHSPRSSGTPEPRCFERVIERGCDKLGIHCASPASAILTSGTSNRAACQYCGQCSRGCTVGAAFSTGQHAIPDAIAAGNLTLVTNAMVREIETDAAGSAYRALYIDKLTDEWRYLYARAFMLAASACESARILLNSRGRSPRQALANASGQVGRNLRDSVGVRMLARFEELEEMPRHNCDGMGPHLMIPWWNSKDVTFESGYEMFFPGGLISPCIGLFDDVSAELEGYGQSLRDACNRRYGSYVDFVVNGGMQTGAKNTCELDPSNCDRWGIPTLRFKFSWTDDDRRLAAHAIQTTKAIVEAAGGTFVQLFFDWQDGIVDPGCNFREAGTAIMGANSDTSVVNAFCQTHDVPNVFVVDSAVFPASPEKAPTLTIMALAWRAAEHLLDSARRGELHA